ncbi:argininosuccinate lyase [Campylobacter sp. RM12654]|uniref:argininosuccinate lyase n=1 Tax=Campylobacter sp. RM12654 TaxID=2735738 RepID=UPI0030149736|nr:argininosuccinate lyase [Campylobacter sp. RM12654]
MKKLWGGRFSQATDKLVENYTATLPLENRLALIDIKGSIAHAKMLERQKIINSQELAEILKGLEIIQNEFIENKFEFNISDEDIHMAIEKRLSILIGASAGKLHTARSRNDQTALDGILQMKEFVLGIKTNLKELMQEILNQAKINLDLIMPGFTHLQTAQPILYSHWIMAYFWMFKRDYDRFLNLYNSLNECPLGSAALAGTTFNIDRFFSANELGFAKPSENSIDSVSNRDYMLEFCSVSAICFSHLSRLCEELIIFNSNDYKFIELSDDFCTGSSIMPQKKNPDVCEKMRGKTGRIYGNLISMLTIMKGLPLAYNTDMSEDKASVYDTQDTIKDSLIIITKLIAKMKPIKENMLRAAANGYSNATDLADYLAKKGVPFRKAHEITGKLVSYAISKKLKLDELSLDELRLECDLIEDDIYKAIDLKTCVDLRNSYGGTSENAVKTQLLNAQKTLENLGI